MNLKSKHHFFGLGTQKAGTSTLQSILNQHSQVFLSPRKETKFFYHDNQYEKGLDFYYDTYFSSYQGEICIGEFDPDYLFQPIVPQRIFDTFGKDMKFIIIFRNPVERAISHYLMLRNRGSEMLSFEEAIAQEPTRIFDTRINVCYKYMQRGLYSEQLQRYYDLFPKSQFLLLVFENDIQKNLDKTILRIQEFLGLPKENLNHETHSNDGKAPRFLRINQFLQAPNNPIKKWAKKLLGSLANPIREKIFQLNTNKPQSKNIISEIQKRALFEHFFQTDTAKLQAMTGLDLSAWEEYV